jgi:hypothetical protein
MAPQQQYRQHLHHPKNVLLQRFVSHHRIRWMGIKWGWHHFSSSEGQQQQQQSLQQQRQQQHDEGQQQRYIGASAFPISEMAALAHQGVRLMSVAAVSDDPEAAAAVDRLFQPAVPGPSGAPGGVELPDPSIGVPEVLTKALRALQTRTFPGLIVGSKGAADKAAAAAAAALLDRQGPLSYGSSLATPEQQQPLGMSDDASSSTAAADQADPAAAAAAAGPAAPRWLLPCSSQPDQRQLARCHHVVGNQELQQRLMVRGLLLSDNCNVSWALSAVELKTAGLEGQAVLYALLALGACLLQVSTWSK